MKQTDKMLGVTYWCGEYKGMATIITNYSGGASMYVFKSGKWFEYARTSLYGDALIPHKCPGCGCDLPHENAKSIE